MEFHYEKFVRKKVTKKQKNILMLMFVLSVIVFPASALGLYIFTGMWFLGLGVMLLLAWLLYSYISKLYIEYEYQFTATVGSVSFIITQIINQRKRKELFSLDCKEFEIMARLNGPKDNSAYKNIEKRFECVKSMEEEDIFFIITHTGHGRTIIFVQLTEEMAEGFRKTIPSKFNDQK